MSHRRFWYVYLLLIVFPFILFSPIILGGKALFWGTPLAQFIPWWTFAWQTLSQGILPSWNNMLGMGAPLIANYQTALFYPATWIYYLMYSIGGVSLMAWSQAVMVVLHLSWAALGMALLIRQLKLGRLAQIIGGISFGLSGYLVARAGFLSINAAAAWMPWIMLGITKLVEAVEEMYQPGDQSQESNKSRKMVAVFSGFLLLVLCLTMQLLAGHAQSLWYTLLLAAAWVAFLVLMPYRKGIHLDELDDSNFGKEKKESISDADRLSTDVPLERLATRKFVVILGLVAAAVILAVGLSAVQLLPTAEYLQQSQRSAAVDYDFAMNYSFWPWRFLTFLAPDLYGNPVAGDFWGYANYWEDAVYIGLIPIVLAAFALITRGRRVLKSRIVTPAFVWFLLVLILASFVIALGRNTPVFPWLFRYIPTFDMFQAPTRISIIGIFCLTLLAAIGAESWGRPGEKSKYWLRLGVMAAAAVTIGAGLAYLFSQSLDWDIKLSFIRSTMLLGFWAIGLGVLALKAPDKDLQEGYGREWGWWQWAVILWVAADLIVAGWGINPGVDVRVYSEPSPSAEEVKKELKGGRIYLSAADEYELKFERFLRFDTFDPFSSGEDWTSLRAALLPNVTILDAIPSTNNFDPLIPGRYANWINILGEADERVKEQMLNLMGATVVESIDPSKEFGIRYDSRDAFSRYYWVPCGLEVQNDFEALEKINNGQLNFQQVVILESESADRQQDCDPLAKAEIRVHSEFPHESILSISSRSPGYLVMSDVWYPGWQSFVDGRSEALLRANYLFRSIQIPAGEHEIVITYRPNWLYFGSAASATSLILLLCIGILWFAKKRRLG